MIYGKFIIVFKKDCIIVYLNNEVFLRQDYIKNKHYTFLYVLHILNKYGIDLLD